MVSFVVYPAEAVNPDVVYLDRTQETLQSPSSMSSLSTGSIHHADVVPLPCKLSIPRKPPISRKSSRRRSRCSMSSTASWSSVNSYPPAPTREAPPPPPPDRDAPAPPSPMRDAPPPPVDPPSSTSSVEEELDRAINEMEQISPFGSEYSLVSRTTTSLEISPANGRDTPPEYPSQSPIGHPADPTNSMTFSVDEKASLRSALAALDAAASDADSNTAPAPEYSAVARDRSSLVSATTTLTPTSTARRTLRIHQRGIAALGLPLKSSQLRVYITRDDGSVAYISTRAKRSSSSCVLFGTRMGGVVLTSYSKGTTLTRMAPGDWELESIAMGGRWLDRAQGFEICGGDGVTRGFEWRYVETEVPNGCKEDRLVLVLKSGVMVECRERGGGFGPVSEKKRVSVMSDSDEPRRLFHTKLAPSALAKQRCPTAESSGIMAAARATMPQTQSLPREIGVKMLAQLIRTPSTLKAGNGGDLVLEKGCTELVPEEVVVASGLVMLKREMDLMRAVQAGLSMTILP